MVITIGFLQFSLPKTPENIILNGLSGRLNVKIKEKEDIKEGFRVNFPTSPVLSGR